MSRLLGLTLLAALLGGCLGLRHPPPAAPPAAEPDAPRQNRAKTAPYKVFGKAYYPVTDATGYRERGVASWYGGKFHGRNTANGERYDMHRFTAAHKTLPLPTWVRVTNLRNGAAVTVRVNDRGPFVKNRLIDLSYAAALKLDMVDDGTTLVEVEALAGPPGEPILAAAVEPADLPLSGDTPDDDPPVAAPEAQAVFPASLPPPEPEPQATAAPARAADPAAASGATPAVEPMDIYVQVGAFGDRANAERVRTNLYNAGIADVRLGAGDIDGVPLHRVQIGPVRGVVEYDSLIDRLESLGYYNTHLVTEFLID